MDARTSLMPQGQKRDPGRCSWGGGVRWAPAGESGVGRPGEEREANFPDCGPLPPSE